MRARRKLDYVREIMRSEGAELVRLAIASGKLPVSSPKPLDPTQISLPNGAPLPPSLAILLSWDASWLESLGWFRTSPSFSWTPRTLGQIAGEDFEVAALSTCFVLSERCIFVVTSEPDARGEYPIVLVDDAEVPFLCTYMAGLDVFLGDLTGVQPVAGATHEDVARDPRFRGRMDHHGRKVMKGRISTDFPRDTLNPRPERRGRNPFNGEELVIPAVPAGEVPIDWAAR